MVNIDSEVKIKGKHAHGNESKFKSLRTLVIGEESNPLFCDVRDNLRNLGHDVITKLPSEFDLSMLQKLVKDYDFVYHLPTPTAPAAIAPALDDDEEDIEIDEVPGADEVVDPLDDDEDEDEDEVPLADDEEEPETV